MLYRRNKQTVFDFEAALREDAEREGEMVEVPLHSKSFFFIGGAVVVVGIIIVLRIVWIGGVSRERYGIRAEANAHRVRMVPAPRGVIRDRYGEVIADNRPSFAAILDVREFMKRRDMREATVAAMRDVLGVGEEEAVRLVRDVDEGKVVYPIVLRRELPQLQVVEVKARNLPTLEAKEGFERTYVDPYAFSHLVGYVGLPTADDLLSKDLFLSDELVGKAGIEFEYDDTLRGIPGVRGAIRNAKGDVAQEEEEERIPVSGKTIELTIDRRLQEYFFHRLEEGLRALGRTSGVGIAFDPRNGDVLALVSLPSFDASLFSASGKENEKRAVLDSPHKPFFNRAVSGMYTPGSTIKPLHAVAALAEGVIDSEQAIFSPGYLDIPNPYDPEHPTRYVDWRYQGYVDVSSALAQSSNVYFYTIGGGTGGRKGLGAARLKEWWDRFGLGRETKIAIPYEAAGFLPSPEWKEKSTGLPWLLGDTYNVSIGQGDLLVTPIQLIRYIGAIANGGMLYVPNVVNGGGDRHIAGDLSYLSREIREVQRGMREAVTSPMGTARMMEDLPIAVAGKTGSAQVSNNTQENAFFVGYAPYEDPQIAVLVLVERSRQGSLNAVPIARDVFLWYYRNRLVSGE